MTPEPPISFTEDGLDQLERELREIVSNFTIESKAADAIAYLRDAYAHSVTSEQSCIEELQTLRRERVPPTSEETAWLHKFINCVPFGADAPVADIQRAHGIADAQSRRIAELEGTLAAWKAKEDKQLTECKNDLKFAQDAGLHFAERIAELQRALEEAIELVKSWHNMGGGADVWPIYYEHSPEMKRIRAALATAQPSEGSNG